jgi:hypothetical protein
MDAMWIKPSSCHALIFYFNLQILHLPAFFDIFAFLIRFGLVDNSWWFEN